MGGWGVAEDIKSKEVYTGQTSGEPHGPQLLSVERDYQTTAALRGQQEAVNTKYLLEKSVRGKCQKSGVIYV